MKKSEPPNGSSLFSYPVVSVSRYGRGFRLVWKINVFGTALLEKYK